MAHPLIDALPGFPVKISAVLPSLDKAWADEGEEAARASQMNLVLMFGAYHFSGHAAVQAMMPAEFRFAAPIFAFGLVAFGFLGMGPVTIAVDSYGPVTDNAQSVYELSQIESHPGITAELKKDFGFNRDFENLLAVAAAVAISAAQIHIGQELHFNRYGPILFLRHGVWILRMKHHSAIA